MRSMVSSRLSPENYVIKFTISCTRTSTLSAISLSFLAAPPLKALRLVSRQLKLEYGERCSSGEHPRQLLIKDAVDLTEVTSGSENTHRWNSQPLRLVLRSLLSLSMPAMAMAPVNTRAIKIAVALITRTTMKHGSSISQDNCRIFAGSVST